MAEFAFSTPIANVPPGSQITTGTIQPGVIYEADTWQLAVEALIPANGASGRNVGAVAELHFFLDDIFPDSWASRSLEANDAQLRHSQTVRRRGLRHRRNRGFRPAQLVKAPPPVGGTDASASEIRLTFSEGVEPRFSHISLSAADGASVPLGATKTEGTRPFSSRLIANPLARRLRVKWSAVRSTRITRKATSSSPSSHDRARWAQQQKEDDA